MMHNRALNISFLALAAALLVAVFSTYLVSDSKAAPSAQDASGWTTDVIGVGGVDGVDDEFGGYITANSGTYFWRSGSHFGNGTRGDSLSQQFATSPGAGWSFTVSAAKCDFSANAQSIIRFLDTNGDSLQANGISESDLSGCNGDWQFHDHGLLIAPAETTHVEVELRAWCQTGISCGGQGDFGFFDNAHLCRVDDNQQMLVNRGFDGEMAGGVCGVDPVVAEWWNEPDDFSWVSNDLAFDACTPNDCGSNSAFQPFTVTHDQVIDRIDLNLFKFVPEDQFLTSVQGRIWELGDSTAVVDSVVRNFVIFGSQVPNIEDQQTGIAQRTIVELNPLTLESDKAYAIALHAACFPEACTRSPFVKMFAWGMTGDTDTGVHDDWYSGYAVHQLDHAGFQPSCTDYENPDCWVFGFNNDYSSVTYNFTLWNTSNLVPGVEPTPTPMPTVPAPGDPPDNAPIATDYTDAPNASYEYFPGPVNVFRDNGTFTFCMDESSGTLPITLQIRRLDSSGEPFGILESLVHNETQACYSLDYSDWPIGPFDVYEPLNDRQLSKHILAPRPTASFFFDADHRCDEFCVVALDAISDNGTQGQRQYQAGSHEHELFVTFGETFDLYFSVPESTELDDGARLAIQRVDQQGTIVDFPLLDLYQEFRGINPAGNGDYWEPTGVTIHQLDMVRFHTAGENIPSRQNLNLAELYATVFPPGVYNYALLESDGTVLAEGESLLIVVPDGVSGVDSTRLTVAPSESQLGGTLNLTASYPTNAICSVFLNWDTHTLVYPVGSPPATLDAVVPWGVPNPPCTTSISTSANLATVEELNPEPGVFPFDVVTRINASPVELPFSLTPDEYSIELTTAVHTIHEECDFFCQNPEFDPGNLSDFLKLITSSVILAATIVLLGLARTPLVPLLLVAGIEAGIWTAVEWLTPVVLLGFAVFGGVGIVLFFIMRNRGE